MKKQQCSGAAPEAPMGVLLAGCVQRNEAQTGFGRGAVKGQGRQRKRAG
jgi:hypothetical protein